MAGTTTTRRKTKKKSNRVQRITIEQAEKEKDEAVAAALKNGRDDWEQEQEELNFGAGTVDETETDASNGSGYFGDGSNDQLIDMNDPRNEAFNIWEFTEREFEKKGTPIKYQIKKDHEIMGELSPPCSWVQLQETWGGGNYQVICRNLAGEYLKGSTQRIGHPPKKDPAAVAPAAPAQPGLNLDNMFTQMSEIFKQMQEMSLKERSKDDRDDKRSNEGFNTTILSLMQAQQQSSSDMFLKIAEMSNNTAKAQSENFSKVLEKMDGKFSTMFEKLIDGGNKKENFGTLDLLKLVNDSRKDGADSMERMFELIEARTPEGGGDDNSKEGLLGSLVRGITPLLAKATASAETATNQIYPQHPMQRIVQPRPNPPPAAPQVPPQQVRQNRTVQHKKTSLEALGITPFTDLVVNEGSVNQNTVKQNTDSIPHSPRALKVNTEATVERETQPKIDRGSNDLYQNSSMAQRTIAELSIPIIGACMANGTTKADAAEMVLGTLIGQGFTPEVVLKEFTFDYLLHVARECGLGDKEKPWLEEFYEAFQSSAGVGNSGSAEHPPNQEL